MFINKVKLRPSFWFMTDAHTFIKPNGKDIHEIKKDLIRISKGNPYGMVCPVTILEGDKEIRRVGECHHVDKDGNVDIETWYSEVVKEPCVRKYKQPRY